MIINFWGGSLIFVSGILFGLLVRYLLTYKNPERICTTCDKTYSSNSNLLQCVTCKEWFCKSNYETLQEGGTQSATKHEVIPSSSKTPDLPCGTKLVTVRVGEKEETFYYCKKHSPRPPYHYLLEYIP